MFKHIISSVKRKTTEVWETENPVLNFNELAVEIITEDNLNIKKGDGLTNWLGLPYLYENQSADDTNEIIDDYLVNNGSRLPVEDFFTMFGDGAGLKSDKIPTDDNDVLRKIDLTNPDYIDKSTIPAPLKIAQYNEDSGLKSGKIPDENDDVIRKLELDNHKDDTAAHSATATPTASRITLYNSDSGLKSGKVPTENNDVIRFLEFNNEISDINTKISTLNGAYFVLDAYNFGKTLNETDPDDILILNTYAIANTPDASSMADVYNDTVVVNEFDSAEYVYNKISGLWVKYPNGYLTIATNDHLGVVKGTQPPADQADESKDTYVQVLSDGAMKLVGDRLGKVNSVDNVEPNTDKNIELTLEMTRAEHAALEDPAGSGLYPSLKGKTVTLTDVYPKNTRRIPMPDYGNQETTNRITTSGGTWTADRTGYVKCGGSYNEGTQGFHIYIDGVSAYAIYPLLITGGATPSVLTVPVAKDNIIQVYGASASPVSCYFVPIKWVDVEED
jgi:hypothetical protein